MSSNTALRVQKHRLSLKEAGLRPIQLWVPDTRSTSFAHECRRQSGLAAAADRLDVQLMSILDEALNDLDNE
jgi:Protein  of unknown function (DUF3018)